MKNKIQIFLFSLFILGFGMLNFSQAYVITGDELDELNDQKTIISGAENSDLWSYYSQFSDRYDILKDNDRLGEISKELKDYSYSIFSNRKSVVKQNDIDSKSDFYDKYSDNITLDIDFPEERCMGRYNTIDNISFANDFPTALVIAVRYRESTCAYYLPSNGDGPFQIVSKDYGTGDITEELFLQTIQDFINFAKHKINWYNTKNEGEYPAIKLSYTGYNYDDLWKFAGLYNGLSGSTVYGEIGPANPKYFLEGYEDYENSSRYGLFPMFLKVLNWETQNI